MARSCVRHHPFSCAPRLICVYGVTHLRMCCDPFICATSLDHIRDMAHFSACSFVSQQGLASAICRAEHLLTSNELCVLSQEPHFRASFEFDMQTLFYMQNLLGKALYVYIDIYVYIVLSLQHLLRRAQFPIETTHWS